jgi:hypothetical protein
MTTFSYPLNLKRPEMAESGAGAVTARVPARYSVVVDTSRTGVAVGATTIPLFVAPAGSTFYECALDVVTAYDNTAGVNITVGTSAIPATLFAATTVNTEGRRSYAGTAAQVSSNSIALTADTTVQAIVSITTSAVTTGSVIVHVVLG